MVSVTAADLAKQFGKYRDLALREPVSVTHHGRETLVMLSVEEFNRLKALEEAMNQEKEKMLDELVNVHRSTLMKLAQR